MDEPSSPEGNAITLRIKFKSASLDEFVARYGADVSAGGIFIRTKQPLAVGTTLHFDFTLGDGSPLVAGMGTVVWVREADASRVGSVPGMGVRFDQLTPEGQQTHQQILVVKAKRQERTGGAPGPLSPGPRLSTPPAPALRVATPAPPAAPVAPAAAAPVAPAAKLDDFSDDFGNGGKTEIADRPPSFYFEAQDGKAAGASAAKPAAGSAVPSEPLDDAVTNSQQIPDSGSGAPSQSVDLAEFSGGVSVPVELLSDSKANEVDGSSSASITDLPLAIDALAAPASAAAGSVPLAGGKESSWLDDALKATSDDSAVPEVALNEPTQETSVAPDTAAGARAPLDETAAVAVPDERAIKGDLSESPAETRVQRAGKSGKGLIIVGSVAAVLAFAGVYLWMAKPWESRATRSQVVPATPVASEETVPAAQPVAAEPAQAPEPVKPAEPAKPAEVVAAAKPVVPASEPAKVEPSSESGKRSGGAAKKASAKSGSPALDPAPAFAPTPASAETAKPGPATGADLVYMLKIKSVPPAARITMDGDPMGTAPFQRRVLDIDKPHSILVQKPGYDSYERTITKADFGAPSGNTSTLSISARLTRLKAGPGAAPAPAVAPEEPAAPTPEQPEKL